LGVEPDFVLKCEIEEGRFLALQALLMRAALHDLKAHRSVWEWKEGDKNEPPVVMWGMVEQLTSPKKRWFSSDKWASNNPGQPKEQVATAIKKATKNLSPVAGHRQLKM
jgi:hypothetical protein